MADREGQWVAPLHLTVNKKNHVAMLSSAKQRIGRCLCKRMIKSDPQFSGKVKKFLSWRRRSNRSCRLLIDPILAEFEPVLFG